MKSQGGAKLLKHAVVKAPHAWDNESKVLVFRDAWNRQKNQMDRSDVKERMLNRER